MSRQPLTPRARLFRVGVLLIAAGIGWWSQRGALHEATGPAALPSSTVPARSQPAGDDGAAAIAQAFADHTSDLQVKGVGEVVHILPDDNEGSRHQRFILELSGGHTVLIAHNIDLAPRIEGLRKGDVVGFNGEYEWNDRGGVVHWTHRDPGGRHEHGWLEHAGQRFE